MKKIFSLLSYFSLFSSGFSLSLSVCADSYSRSTKNCKLCNPCCNGFDHHCMWLISCMLQQPPALHPLPEGSGTHQLCLPLPASYVSGRVGTLLGLTGSSMLGCYNESNKANSHILQGYIFLFGCAQHIPAVLFI